MRILIKNGTVIDGSGEQGYKADVLVEKDLISDIRKDIPKEAGEIVIDAQGKAVCPGFIDVHCHTDWSILEERPWDDHQERQGITTQIAGLCGTSPLSLEDHFRKVTEKGLGTNYGLMVGHGSVRKSVLGEEKRAPTSEEMKEMKKRVRKAMEEGAFGLSTGLIYVPGRYATTEEVTELAKVAASYGGIYATHMRSESDEILKALDEALDISRKAEMPLEISHIKVIMARNWGLSERMIEKIIAAREKGLKVTADQYPYTVTGGGFYGSERLIEGFRKDEEFDTYKKKYGDERERLKMLGYIQELLKDRGGAEHFIITKCGGDPGLLGRNLAEAADERNISPKVLILDAIMTYQGEFAMVYAGVSEEEMIRFMKEPYVMVGTDGVQGSFHPRTHGTFPRILGRYVREKNVLCLEEAVRKMTSLPAGTFGLSKRGRVLPKYIADLVVFDPEKVIDNADLVHPHQYPSGIDWVLVNGSIVVANGQREDVFPGVVLTRDS